MLISPNPLLVNAARFRESFAQFLQGASARADGAALTMVIGAVSRTQWQSLPATDLLPLLLHPDCHVRAATIRCAVPHVSSDASYYMFQMLTQDPEGFRERFLEFIAREEIRADNATLRELLLRLQRPNPAEKDAAPLGKRLKAEDVATFFSHSDHRVREAAFGLLQFVKDGEE